MRSFRRRHKVNANKIVKKILKEDPKAMELVEAFTKKHGRPPRYSFTVDKGQYKFNFGEMFSDAKLEDGVPEVHSEESQEDLPVFGGETPK